MRKKRVLIVDDDEEMRALLFKSFTLFGYKAETVENGIEAIKRIAVKTYDLIVTDYKMPKMDGLELIQRIKTIIPSIPVIVVTGYGLECEFLKSGALARIRKPFSIFELQKIAQNILDGRPPLTPT